MLSSLKLVVQLVLYDIKNSIPGVSDGVDAHSLDFQDAILGCSKYPVCFGRTAICYKDAVCHKLDFTAERVSLQELQRVFLLKAEPYRERYWDWLQPAR